jgi:hypothetical protein
MEINYCLKKGKGKGNLLLWSRSFVAALLCRRAFMSPRSYVAALLCRTLFCRALFLRRAFVAIPITTKLQRSRDRFFSIQITCTYKAESSLSVKKMSSG